MSDLATIIITLGGLVAAVIGGGAWLKGREEKARAKGRQEQQQAQIEEAATTQANIDAVDDAAEEQHDRTLLDIKEDLRESFEDTADKFDELADAAIRDGKDILGE